MTAAAGWCWLTNFYNFMPKLAEGLLIGSLSNNWCAWHGWRAWVHDNRWPFMGNLVWTCLNLFRFVFGKFIIFFLYYSIKKWSTSQYGVEHFRVIGSTPTPPGTLNEAGAVIFTLSPQSTWYGFIAWPVRMGGHFAELSCFFDRIPFSRNSKNFFSFVINSLCF